MKKMSTKLPALHRKNTAEKKSSLRSASSKKAKDGHRVNFGDLKISLKEEEEKGLEFYKKSKVQRAKLKQLAFTGVKKDKLAEKRLVSEMTLGDLTVKSFGWLMKRRQVAHKFRDPVKQKQGSMLTMDQVGKDMARFDSVSPRLPIASTRFRAVE